MGRRSAAKLASEKFGVRISPSTARRAASTPGVGPQRLPGRKLIVPAEVEHKLEDLVLVLRQMQLPCFRFMIINYVNTLIKGTAIAEQLKHKEVRRHWYYNWLSRCKRLTTANLKPLELTRAQWATVENVEKHYNMLAELLIDLKLAVPNPSYDPEVKLSERVIIVKPGRIASMDETRLTNDTTEKTKGKRNRSIVSKGNDSREALANKGGGDGTGIGGSTADGIDLPGFFIFANDIIHAADVDMTKAPVCRRRNPQDVSKPLPCRFWTNEKGGVTGDLGIRYIRGCVEPAMPELSPENPGLLIMDGHGSHFTLELLMYCREIGLHVVLRPPHTTHILQGEDVVHFNLFKDLYVQSKLLKLGAKIFKGTYKLTVGDMLDVVREPWQIAFNQANCLKAWSEIGVSPFNQRVLWELREKRENVKATAELAEIDPSLLTIEGMVKIVFGVSEDDAAQRNNGSRKRDRNTLHSSDLWDCPGGVTGEEAFEKIRAKTEERKQKEAATRDKKEQRAASRAQRDESDNDIGSRVIEALVHAGQVQMLLKPQLVAALKFKCVPFVTQAKKPVLAQLLQDKLALPSDGPPPPLNLPRAPAAAPAVAPAPSPAPAAAAPSNPNVLAQADDDEGSGSSDEDASDDNL